MRLYEIHIFLWFLTFSEKTYTGPPPQNTHTGFPLRGATQPEPKSFIEGGTPLNPVYRGGTPLNPNSGWVAPSFIGGGRHSTRDLFYRGGCATQPELMFWEFFYRGGCATQPENSCSRLYNPKRPPSVYIERPFLEMTYYYIYSKPPPSIKKKSGFHQKSTKFRGVAPQYFVLLSYWGGPPPW